MNLVFDFDNEKEYQAFKYSSALHDRSILRNMLNRTAQNVESSTDLKATASLELRKKQFELLEYYDGIIERYEKTYKEDS